ncbi:MAG: preprotein translocase subunit SecE [Anaerolineales bacterium]|nr:preprotein translocase subunit SecE [Anaerolineales bacterium]
MAKSRAASKKKSNPVVRYLRETRAELKKVTWPTRPEATKLTIIVLIVVAFMSALLGTLDYIFSRLMGFIISLG